MRKPMTMILGVGASAALLAPALAHGAPSSNVSLAAISAAGVLLGHIFGRPLRA